MLDNPAHTLDVKTVLAALDAPPHGLSDAEAGERLVKHGRNELPRSRGAGLALIFLRQFLNPLIYALLLAAGVSIALGHLSDAAIILVVLLSNAVIGTTQEHGAQRSADALRRLTVTLANVLRDGESRELQAEEIVPGDVVQLETGAKVPADLRLLTASSLQVEESLLTGESAAVHKDAAKLLTADAPLGDRVNMAFAGTHVTRGRALGVVTATASHTELGRIAELAAGRSVTKPPLLLRMESFTRRISVAIFVAVAVVGGAEFARGRPLDEVLLAVIALAVSVIPEGLPVALTVALAIAARRMARRKVIVRRMVAVEALGSCTFIACDKTGPVTMNELTVGKVAPPAAAAWEVTGQGMTPEGKVVAPGGAVDSVVKRIARAVTLCNEAFLGRREGQWVHHGDSVDVSLLVFAHKLGITRAIMEEDFAPVASLPFESERQFAAALNSGGLVSVKGALERLLPMCSRMATESGDVPLEARAVEAQAHELAAQGYRVLGVAGGDWQGGKGDFGAAALKDLTFLGLVATQDPLRADARESIERCRAAGVDVAMVTGDHPVTALAIARQLGLASKTEEVVTGAMLRGADPKALKQIISGARVFARVEPEQKLLIVKALSDAGHFVAVTGDGANDAPALRAAHVGVAMGKSGTDVAREASQLILADDAFSSIVAGIEEGRVAYANVRKVVFILMSTGAAEVVLFMLALAAGLPLPLLAVQLLWLNLVTNGIQDVAMAFEPGEGDELKRPPRPPKEGIFNASMVMRIAISALVMGGVGCGAWAWMLNADWPEESARNSLLLLMVLFENMQVGNGRSETRSIFSVSPLSNKILVIGTLAAQGIHIAAMYIPGLNTLLHLQPVSLQQWAVMLGLAFTLVVAMEIYKLIVRRATRPVQLP